MSVTTPLPLCQRIIVYDICIASIVYSFIHNLVDILHQVTHRARGTRESELKRINARFFVESSSSRS